MLGVKTRLNSSRAGLAGRIDAVRLKAAHPRLAPRNAEWASLRTGLRSIHQDYIENVSTAEMAVSLETATYLHHLCRATSATSVLDLGSGFSSYVLRRYAAEAEYPVLVTSVDDDAHWLERTADFLRQQRYDVGGLTQWSEYLASPTGPHSVVFHDLANGELREAAMEFATTQVSRHGVIVFDDAQHGGHRERMYAEGSRAGFRMFSLSRRTFDSIGRWAVLGVA